MQYCLYHKSSKGLMLIIRDVKLEGGRQRHPSGGVSAKEMVIGLEGVELGADGKVRDQHKCVRVCVCVYKGNILAMFLLI